MEGEEDGMNIAELVESGRLHAAGCSSTKFTLY
jgi:hypothetical protein